MSVEMERRRDAGDLRYAVDGLTSAVGDLKLTVGELKITVATMKERDSEDRQNARQVMSDVIDLKLWRSRLKGQMALLWSLFGVVLGGGAIDVYIRLSAR